MPTYLVSANLQIETLVEARDEEHAKKRAIELCPHKAWQYARRGVDIFPAKTDLKVVGVQEIPQQPVPYKAIVRRFLRDITTVTRCVIEATSLREAIAKIVFEGMEEEEKRQLAEEPSIDEDKELSVYLTEEIEIYLALTEEEANALFVQTFEKGKTR